jgi:hypothetical protein
MCQGKGKDEDEEDEKEGQENTETIIVFKCITIPIRSPLVQKLMEAFASQSTIGWKYVFRGLVSKKWAEAFAYNNRGDNSVRAGQWTRLFNSISYYSFTFVF